MSFWDTVLDKAVPAIIDVGTSIYQANTNAHAARQAAAGEAAGNAAYQKNLDEIRKETAPARGYLHRIVGADPYRLTPEQQRDYENMQMNARRALTASPLRGSGRATVRAFNEMDQGYRDRLTGDNRTRADNAATGLARIGYGATMDAGAANRDTAVNIANIGAQSDLANARLAGQALGDITSFISSSNKQSAATPGIYDSSYENTNKQV